MERQHGRRSRAEWSEERDEEGAGSPLRPLYCLLGCQQSILGRWREKMKKKRNEEEVDEHHDRPAAKRGVVVAAGQQHRCSPAGG